MSLEIKDLVPGNVYCWTATKEPPFDRLYINLIKDIDKGITSATAILDCYIIANYTDYNRAIFRKDGSNSSGPNLRPATEIEREWLFECKFNNKTISYEDFIDYYNNKKYIQQNNSELEIIYKKLLNL